ncbi:chymotrypsin inhibitor Ani s 6-like [Armigeres subalbatus]|uniref:chymotrypsin inhibitor Ani s 6-like n=1 Tax=Armigeres subalbatus TaxID=124917 RepID=UPI002ED03828
MKFAAIAILVASVCIHSVFSLPPPPGCRKCHCKLPFEEYQVCGTGCPKTCDNLLGGVCATVCVPGCFCKEGYVRNREGFCVLPEQCPCATTTTPEPTTTTEPCTTTTPEPTTTTEPCTTPCPNAV